MLPVLLLGVGGWQISLHAGCAALLRMWEVTLLPRGADQLMVLCSVVVMIRTCVSCVKGERANDDGGRCDERVYTITYVCIYACVRACVCFVVLCCVCVCVCVCV